MDRFWIAIDWLALVLSWVSLAGWAVTFASTLATLYLVAEHWRLRAAGTARESALLAHGLPPDEDLPHVVVQIPTYNEGAMVARALDAAIALDWPRDRLHIQVLDDSTDGSTLFARQEAADRRALGFDVLVIHRTNRTEYKAGALAHAMTLTRHDFFAILDVDYVPQPDFLRKTMTCLLAAPNLAFIQARFDYINRDANDLTRTQAVLLDAHLAIEQGTRCWGGHPLPFNGTCGVWRREAIEAAGGWRGGTLAEDLDLSYRAWRIGRRGSFLMSVPVPGELPETMKAWMTQQQRWTKGFGEVMLRLLWPILGDASLSLADRCRAAIHLGVWWSGIAWGVALPAGVAAVLLASPLRWTLAALLLGQLAVGYVALFLFLRAGNLSLRPGATTFGRFLRDFLFVSRDLFRIGAAIGPAQREVIFRKRSEFVRTPKSAAQTAYAEPVPVPVPAAADLRLPGGSPRS
ncbi:glycosyltransferase family 2 protein [Labrys monachus]|uniref:Cellulose synthase/poly-beta-1,6-N-acetylglucosamine synthase-like glycosyltransferase n=1 Tax=Labrys monachus TaxID=217067 RepID=A0ABU0FDR5_9HYPH|nr:glycosyltransferase family 2 protein [Labrys monachus]MDQ0392268.1 cellulose synthase/poly-beta-1,6-N-acetylglucosamine synthase-like glycosyltransferase [Labrys monachus]